MFFTLHVCIIFTRILPNIYFIMNIAIKIYIHFAVSLCNAWFESRKVWKCAILTWCWQFSFLSRIPICIYECSFALIKLSCSREFVLRLNVLIQPSFRIIIIRCWTHKPSRSESVICFWKCILRLVLKSWV